MPIHLTEAYSNDSGSSGKPHQSSWMPCSNRFTRKHGSLIVPHSQTLCKEEGLLHHKKKRICTSLNLASDIPSYKRAQNLGKDGSDSEPFGLIGHNALAPRILMDPSCSYGTNSQSSRKRNLSRLVLATAGSDLRAQRDEDDPIKAMVVSTRFRNSNFAMPGEGSSKYEKFSAILVKEKNGLSAVLSRGSGNPPLFSQTETRSFFITKRAGGDVSKANHHGGVKIQPLWSSTDSENQTREGEPSCEPPSTAESDKRKEVAALSNKNDSFGVISPSSVNVSQDETVYSTSVDAKDDKGRGKLLRTSAMDSMEPSSSRTQSLEVEEHLCCSKQPSESKPSNLWVKRLKPSSSEVGESPARTPSPDPEQSMKKGESCCRKDAVFQSPWIQRWCQDHSVEKHRRLHKGAVVTCEPDSSKVRLDELEKKQFPSIAAMALMGKSMTGFRPCKLTKRGPLVIWNTEDT